MISKRIKELASLIEKNESFVDVGCDHGYLVKLARENGNTQLLICTDNKIGPLNSARDNLSDYKNIKYYLTDGLTDIKEKVDTVVIAGMGCNTIEHILSDSKDYIASVDKLILQSNNNVPKLRKWLVDNNYMIVFEKVVYDYKYYEIIVAKKGKQELDELQIAYGPCLLKNHDSQFLDYLNFQLFKINEILAKNVNNPQLENKKIQIEKILNIK